MSSLQVQSPTILSQVSQVKQKSPTQQPLSKLTEAGPQAPATRPDRHQQSLLKTGLISGAATGSVLGLASVPLIPHVIVNAGVGFGSGIIGGLAGIVAAQTAETRTQAALYGAALGAAAGLTLALSTTDVSYATAVITVAGALSGTIGGLSSTWVD